MSTTGVSPVTVIVSASAPTFSSALTVIVPEPASSSPSRFTVLNPVSVKVIEYAPGLRSTILYWPWPSATTERTFSIRAGLAASTVTPGSTAPEASLTTPAIPPVSAWAHATTGRYRREDTTTRRARVCGIISCLLRQLRTHGSPPFTWRVRDRRTRQHRQLVPTAEYRCSW